MAAPFSRTLGAVHADRARAALTAGVIGSVLLATWVVWMCVGRITVYLASDRGRLEVTPGPTQVAAHSGGRITEVQLAVGSRVRMGDVLVKLDSATETIALERARSRLAAIEPELASVARELDAELDAGHSAATADQAAEREAIARKRAAEAELKHARAEERRARKMFKEGVLPAAELSRAITETKARRASLEALSHAAGGRGADSQQREAERNARREQLGRQRAELEANIATVRGEIAQLQHELEVRTLRAPIDGVLGEVAALRPGAVLADGAIVATIVPDGTLQAVAEYGPSAIGRLSAGQRAHVRLDGFPWTHYGTLVARVARVGSELRDGRIRVELALEPGGAAIPIAHGMTGIIDVEVERVSPTELLVRAIGGDSSR